MPATIKIPKLNSPVPGYQLPAINVNDDPYDAVASSLGKLHDAVYLRELQDARAKAFEQQAEEDRIARERNERLRQPETDGNESVVIGEDSDADTSVRVADPTAPSGMRVILRSDLEAHAARNQRVRQERVGRTFDIAAGLARQYPMEAGTIRDEMKGLRDGLTTEQQTALDERYRRIEEGRLRGLIELNPKHALEILRSREGAAEEDLGISEPVRRSLELEAEIAAKGDAQTAEDERLRREARAFVESQIAINEAVTGHPHGYVFYNPLIDGVVAGSKAGRRIEADFDAANEKIFGRAEAGVAFGKSVNGRGKYAWNAAAEQGHDDNYKLLERYEKNGELKPGWKVEYAKLTGRVPYSMKLDVTSGIMQTGDPQRRLIAVKLFDDLRRADGGSEKLSGGFDRDVWEVGVEFGVLTDSGFSGESALKRIDAAKKLTPEQRAARGIYFDRHADAGAMMSVLGEAYGTEVADGDGKARDLLLRPGEEGHAETLPYTGGGSAVPLSGAVGGQIPERKIVESPKQIFDPSNRHRPAEAEGEVVDGPNGKTRTYRLGIGSIQVPAGPDEAEIVAGINYLSNLSDPNGDPLFGADGGQVFANDATGLGVNAYDRFGRLKRARGVPQRYTWDELRAIGQLANGARKNRWPPTTQTGVRIAWNEPTEVANLEPDWWKAKREFRRGDGSDRVIDPEKWGVSDDSETFARKAQRAADGEEGFSPTISRAIKRAQETGEPQEVEIFLPAEPPYYEGARGLVLGLYGLRVKGVLIVKDGRYIISGRGAVDNGGKYNFALDGWGQRGLPGKIALLAAQILPDPTAVDGESFESGVFGPTIGEPGKEYSIRPNRDANVQLWGVVK